MTARPIATRLPGHGYMDDVITERSFDSQADVFGLFCGMLSMVFVQPGTGRRPVD